MQDHHSSKKVRMARLYICYTNADEHRTQRRSRKLYRPKRNADYVTIAKKPSALLSALLLCSSMNERSGRVRVPGQWWTL